MKLKYSAELDPQFSPMAVVYRDFLEEVKKTGGEKLVIGIERNNGYVSTFATTVFAENSGRDQENIEMTDRIVKSLLWFRGGYKIIIAG